MSLDVIHKIVPLVQTQTNPLRTISPYFFKIHINIILSCTGPSGRWVWGVGLDGLDSWDRWFESI
jgi:hypothetical protein